MSVRARHAYENMKPAMRWACLALLLAFLAGCSSDSVHTSGRFIWDNEVRSYSIVSFEEKNHPPGGIQHRRVRVVVPAPREKAEVERAAKEIYRELVADIDKAEPNAKAKRVSILIYDSIADAKAFDGNHICHVESPDVGGRSLPDWKGAKVSWNWRDPAVRPPPTEISLFDEYWSSLDECRRVAEQPYWDSDGIFRGTAEDQPEIDKRLRAGKGRLAKRLMASHGLTEEQLSDSLARVFLWRNGSPFSDESVREMAHSFRDDWRP